ncbi:hypothetical protein AVM15_00830 [Paraclostridium benzoelyticum]|nr:hypothetical protein AVM15_00830 [Paraclostridium benzoelyticum]
MKNNKKLVIGLLALSVCTFIGSTNIASANEIKPFNEVKNINTSKDTKVWADWVLGVVTADELNVRSGPGSNYTAIDSISYGHQVYISKNRSNGFYYIRYTDNNQEKYGWVSSAYVWEYC